MKTDKEMISDLMRRKDEYDAKRQARSKRGSYVCIMAAILAVVILEISVPASVFTAASRKGNTPASPAASVDTEPEETTGSDRVNPDDTTSYETRGSAEDSAEITSGKQQKTDFQYGITADFYAKDKQDQIVLSNDEYGRKTWLNADTIRRYEIDLPLDVREGYDYVRYKDSFYGYKKTSEIHEIEIRLKNSNKWAGDEFLIRIEAPDCVEILSDTTIKSTFPTVKNEEWNSYEPGDYVSIPLVFRFTGEERWTDFKVYLFRRSEGNEYHGKFDYITEAEEYFSSGKSMADKEYPSWQELQGEFDPLHNAGSNYFTARFMEIKGYDFLLTSSTLYGSLELYERVAKYFGDVDENGVPIFITEPDHPDYNSPFKLPMLSDIPGYDSKYNGYTSKYNGRDDLIASPTLDYTSVGMNSAKGGVIRLYYINLSGNIKWSINDDEIVGTDNGLRPANGVEIRIYNNTDNSLIKSTSTSNTGNYSFSFTTPAVEPLNLRVEAWLCYNNINIVDENAYVVHQIIKMLNDVPTNTSETASYSFVNGIEGMSVDNKNRAVSAHQSLVIGYNYAQSRQEIPDSPSYGLTVSMNDSDGTYYFSNDVIINLRYKDAFDWDVSQHEYGHYIEDINGIFCPNGYDQHNITNDLLDDNYKEDAICLAWSEGFATFFAVNAQRVMNAAALNVPYVGDDHYSDHEEAYDGINNSNVDVDIEFVVDYINTGSIIDHGETTEITNAALLYDLVDGVSSTDADVTSINDAAIWRSIIGDETVTTDGCSTLSQFMVAFHNSTEINGSQKMNSAYLMRRYNLDPYNISVQNANTASPTVTWTNPGSAYHNRIRVFDSSYNQIYQSPFLVYQTSFSIPADDWAAIKSGRTYVMIVVECVGALYPMTPGYYSVPVYKFF